MSFNPSPDRLSILEPDEIEIFENELKLIIQNDPYFKTLNARTQSEILDAVEDGCEYLYDNIEKAPDPISITNAFKSTLAQIYIAIPQEKINQRGSAEKDAEDLLEAIQEFGEELLSRKISQMIKFKKIEDSKSFLDLGNSYLSKSINDLTIYFYNTFKNPSTKKFEKQMGNFNALLHELKSSFVGKDGKVVDTVVVGQVFLKFKMAVDFLFYKPDKDKKHKEKIKNYYNPDDVQLFFRQLNDVQSILTDNLSFTIANREQSLLSSDDVESKREMDQDVEAQEFLLEVDILKIKFEKLIAHDIALNGYRYEDTKNAILNFINDSFTQLLIENENYMSTLIVFTPTFYFELLKFMTTDMKTGETVDVYIVSDQTKNDLEDLIDEMDDLFFKRVIHIHKNSDNGRNDLVSFANFPRTKNFAEIEDAKISKIMAKLGKLFLKTFSNEKEEDIDFIKRTRTRLIKINNLLIKEIESKYLDIANLKRLIISRLNLIFIDPKTNKIKKEFNRNSVAETYKLVLQIVEIMASSKIDKQLN